MATPETEKAQLEAVRNALNAAWHLANQPGPLREGSPADDCLARIRSNLSAASRELNKTLFNLTTSA